MKLLAKLFLVCMLSLAVMSCTKNRTGGNATLKGKVVHHGKAIANAYVYVKFNTSEFPGDNYSSYDTYVEADASGNYSIPFYQGTYYIFAMGRDMDIAYPYKVQGGLSISIRNKENLEKDIAVTED